MKGFHWENGYQGMHNYRIARRYGQKLENGATLNTQQGNMLSSSLPQDMEVSRKLQNASPRVQRPKSEYSTQLQASESRPESQRTVGN